MTETSQCLLRGIRHSLEICTSRDFIFLPLLIAPFFFFFFLSRPIAFVGQASDVLIAGKADGVEVDCIIATREQLSQSIRTSPS
jgi:hypothetical protein